MAIPNLEDYNSKKTDNRIVVTKAVEPNQYAISTKRWNAETGEVEYDVIGCNVEELDKAIADKQSEVDALVAFKGDLLAVK
jgi:hypothetical protein